MSYIVELNCRRLTIPKPVLRYDVRLNDTFSHTFSRCIALNSLLRKSKLFYCSFFFGQKNNELQILNEFILRQKQMFIKIEKYAQLMYLLFMINKIFLSRKQN